MKRAWKKITPKSMIKIHASSTSIDHQILNRDHMCLKYKILT